MEEMSTSEAAVKPAKPSRIAKALGIIDLLNDLDTRLEGIDSKLNQGTALGQKLDEVMAQLHNLDEIQGLFVKEVILELREVKAQLHELGPEWGRRLQQPEVPKADSGSKAAHSARADYAAGSSTTSLSRSESKQTGLSRMRDSILKLLERRKFNFSAEWELPAVLRGTNSKEIKTNRDALGSTLILAGSATDCETCTCEDYMSRKWPEIYSQVLEAAAKAIDHQAGSQVSNTSKSRSKLQTWTSRNGEECEIEMTAFDDRVDVQTQGSDKVLAAVAEAVAWLCAAVRVWPPKGVMLSDVEINEKGNIRLLSLKTAASSSPGACWHKLFEAAVIASEPVPPGSREGSGLELSFDEMAYLAGIVVQLEIGPVKALAGYSTLLIPVGELNSGSVQWHLELWGDAAQRDLLSALAPHSKSCLAERMDVLRKKKAFLGWNSSERAVNVRLGTHGAEYNLATSAAVSTTVYLVDSIQDQMGGQFGHNVFTALFSRAVTRKPAPPVKMRFNSDEVLGTVISEASDNPTVLYDTAANRGWMVTGERLLHHAIISRLKEPVLKSPEDYDDDDDDEGELPYVGLQGQNWRTARDILDEEQDTMVVTRSVKDYVIGMATVLNAMRDTLRYAKRRSWEVWGVDFEQVATAREGDTIDPKTVILPKSCGGWHQIVDRSWVIFCKSFGEVIRPADDVENQDCGRTSVPESYGFLAATASCLSQVANNHQGNRDTLFEITNKLYRSERHPINSHGGQRCRCVELQKLSKKRPLSYQTVMSSSAVVFGDWEDYRGAR